MPTNEIVKEFKLYPKTDPLTLSEMHCRVWIHINDNETEYTYINIGQQLVNEIVSKYNSCPNQALLFKFAEDICKKFDRITAIQLGDVLYYPVWP